ncbi:hypothetical protein ACFIQF_01695 [Comamonas sp. J-3]|uniref:hypothetical protein n=1 Tax=Comamonas trifloxystrobinivorans TaxID=3350256 RepID=UPI00372711F3
MTPDKLHWTESNIESIGVAGRTVSIVASQVFVLGEQGMHRIRATFHNVSRARLEVTEYIGPPQAPAGFSPAYVIEKVEPLTGGSFRSYGIEGISTFLPIAWLDFQIHAETAVVEVL